ncbi:helix-turn-helix transcriptional regulator [Nocardia arthritidis]|uniref:Helix-turn-helix domain-containing protein n=1 Tax=Nocardia arthritidis TaxID=228602 RepID=A0A6G9YNH4_9NOCA|nr:helix-turn-helix transcriptional regulator [Nocardia arthritidis]QIS14855.1 helix-turn-helix domain-containing protein [Nocardia arthritidis]
MSESQRTELAAFLRIHRSRLRPADVGLPPDLEPGRRRTPGLRREEVAALAGVSTTWYTWLEQGRKIAASPQVVDALARALRLDAVRHRHLRRLAGLPDPVIDHPLARSMSRQQRLVDALMPNLAVLHDSWFDFVVWNAAYAKVRLDPDSVPLARRNLMWFVFADPRNRNMVRPWEPMARATLSQFRTAVAQRPDDPRLNAVIAEVAAASPEFRTWWAEYPVQDFRPAVIGIDHPEVGLINLELYQSRLVEDPDLLLVLQLPVGEEDRRRVRALLG